MARTKEKKQAFKHNVWGSVDPDVKQAYNVYCKEYGKERMSTLGLILKSFMALSHNDKEVFIQKSIGGKNG